jgi:hypothetical protein
LETAVRKLLKGGSVLSQGLYLHRATEPE